MSNVVDLRTNLILREVREHGTLAKACAATKVTAPILKDLLSEYPGFALSIAECMMEFAEERVLKSQAKKYALLNAGIALSKKSLDAETARLVREARNAVLS